MEEEKREIEKKNNKDIMKIFWEQQHNNKVQMIANQNKLMTQKEFDYNKQAL